MEKMHFLNIPCKVIKANVLPYLEWNDLLRFRRVCTWTNAISNAYIEVHPELAPEIEISEDEGKNFRAFLKMGIPTTKIYLNNSSGSDFCTNACKDTVQFLEEFGSFVKHLRVDQLSFMIFGKEHEFLESLKNLDSLVAKSFGGYRRGLNWKEIEEDLLQKKSLAEKDPRIEDGVFFPFEAIRRLRTLKIGNNYEYDGFSLAAFDYIKLFLVTDSAEGRLESIALPFNPDANPPSDSEYTELQGRPLSFAFQQLSDQILQRLKQVPPTENYKVIDFVNYHDRVENELRQFFIEWNGSPYFIQLSCLCVGEDDFGMVKLMNVGSSWYMVSRKPELSTVDTSDLGTPVYSLVNIHPSCLSLEMPNLEKIHVKRTSCSSPGNDWRNGRPEWPSLKVLEITVDSKTGEYFDWSEDQQRQLIYTTKTSELFNFFFEDVSRTAITELRLEFVGDAGPVPFPKMESIVSSCPNLKKLTIVNWPGSNKALTKLWSGLPGLEEVSLKYCRGLGNVAFVGEDVRSPVFLKLSKLKKLSLKGLGQMPKITDTLFSLVIRHLKLTHLFLSSDGPVSSVTTDGIRSLRDGAFAESIEKLPFNNWSLLSASDAEFRKLEATFRSFDMI